MRKIFLSILILLLTISLFSIEFTTINEMKYPADLAFKMPDTVEEARCLDVKDGKTIKVRYSGLVEKEKTVELLGVDVSQFESEAKTILEQLIKGENIYLSYDWKATEEGIIKAYVWKHFPNLFGGHNLMINAILLANGYALVDEEEYISADMAAIFFETSQTAMNKKYGELKRFSDEQPIDFYKLEEEIKQTIYERFWETSLVSTNTIDKGEEDFEDMVFEGRAGKLLTDPFEMPPGTYRVIFTTDGFGIVELVPMDNIEQDVTLFNLSSGEASDGASTLYKSEGEKVMLQFSNTSEPFRLEFEKIDE